MTEAEWLNATDPQAMLAFLRDGGNLPERKARLFAVAVCRRFLHLVHDHRVGEALHIAEAFADGLVGDEERSNARKAAQQAAQVRGTIARPHAPKWERRAASLAYYAAARHAVEAAWNVPDLAVEVLVWRAGGYNACDHRAIKKEVGLIHADLLRDIFGPLPFRPVTLPFRPVVLHPSVRTWNDGCIVKLATAAYEQRSLPKGTLDPFRLGVLADALEEAGITDQDIVMHLRSPGPHVRGCWALDLVLDRT